MDETQIKKIVIICSIAGLILLYYVSFSSPNVSKISEITIEDVGRHMRACGTITDVRVSNNHIFFTLDDSTDSIKVVVFNTTALRLNQSGDNLYEFSVGDAICMPGTVDEYPKNSGNLELIYREGVIEKII